MGLNHKLSAAGAPGKLEPLSCCEERRQGTTRPICPVSNAEEPEGRRVTTEKSLFTADDLLRLPDDGMRLEIMRGELRSMPCRSAEHGLIAGQALILIRDLFPY
jgi:hypothetical protein